MKTFLVCLCIFFCLSYARAQDGLTSSWRFSLGSGFAANTSSDGKLNELSYSGETFRAFVMRGSYIWKNNSINLVASSTKTTQHVEEVARMYMYNRIDRQIRRLTLSHIHRLVVIRNNLSISMGVANTILYSGGEQRFKSLLYPQGRNQRKSYVFSPVSVSALMDIDYQAGRGHFFSRLGYTVVSLAERPGDNFVKQIDLDYSSYWRRYDATDIPGWQYSVGYEYSFGRIAPSLSYEVFFDQYGSYKSFQRMVSAQIALVF